MKRFAIALTALSFAAMASAQQSGSTATTPFTATGGASAATAQQRAGHNLNVIDDFGAYGDARLASFLGDAQRLPNRAGSYGVELRRRGFPSG